MNTRRAAATYRRSPVGGREPGAAGPTTAPPLRGCSTTPAAITRASTFTLPRSAPRERVGHHWIDLARGYLLHGDHQRALATLQRARRTTPQQTRYHPQVHETVGALARASKRRTDTLTNFAGWLGITT